MTDFSELFDVIFVLVNLVIVVSVMDNVFFCNFFTDIVYSIFISRAIRFVIFWYFIILFLLEERFFFFCLHWTGTWSFADLFWALIMFSYILFAGASSFWYCKIWFQFLISTLQASLIFPSFDCVGKVCCIFFALCFLFARIHCLS